MECTLTGRNTQVTPELRDLVLRRLSSLERLIGDAVVSADMVVATERHLYVSELVVHARGDHRLHGIGHGDTWQIAVGEAVDKVMRQAQTLKGKWQGRRRRIAPPRSDAAGVDSDTLSG